MELAAVMFYDDLVERCKKGSMSAYKELYEKYAEAMYNTSLRIVNNSNDAEDIVQESFMNAFKSIGEFNYESTFGAWIKRIVINLSINHLKKRKLTLIDISSITIYLAQEEDQSDPEIDYKIESIKKALRLLPDGYRTVFILKAFEDLSYEEIAEALSVSTVTARTQYHRAKNQLIQLIKKGL